MAFVASWRTAGNLAIGVFLNGDALPNVEPHGERITDDSFVALFNASDADLDFVLPDSSLGAEWARVLDTAPDDVDDALPHTGDRRARPRPCRTAVRITSRRVPPSR